MENFSISKLDGVRTIILNRPTKKNSFTTEMYVFLTNLLDKDALDDEIVVTLITGKGDYFSSGADFSGPMSGTSADKDISTVMDEGNLIFKNFISAFINYPKIIIAIINGPAIGIGTTIAGLCDIVYATENATFYLPFVNLGLCCEGLSSYLFPRILGRSKASEALLLGKKLSADEAYRFGLISEIVPSKQLDDFIGELKRYGALPLESVKINKKLIMYNLKKTFEDTNDVECRTLRDCQESEQFFKAVMSFIDKKKSKL